MLKNIVRLPFLAWITALAFLMACDSQPQKNKKEKEQPVVDIQVPSFSGDSAYQLVARQVAFGPRVPNTPAHRACGDFIVQTLNDYGAKVQEQNFTATAFDGTQLYLRNIIGSLYPQRNKRILLAAHWDTRPFADQDSERRDEPIPGANDGGSGVAVLLEIARVISETPPPNVGVDFIFFDGEDYGEPDDYIDSLHSGKIYWCLGSQHWSLNKHQPGYTAYYGILFDMVGARGAQFYREGYSLQAAPFVVERVWNTAQRLGYGNYFIFRDSEGIIDDHVFVNRDAKINMIDIIEYDPSQPEQYFGSYWHTHEDDMDIIDSQTLKAVGQTTLQLLFTE